MKRLLISLTLLAMAFSPAAFAQNADKKENCEIVGGLAEAAAVLRDRGYTKEQTLDSMNEALPDLKELNAFIVEPVYMPELKQHAPAEFKKDFYNNCQRKFQ